MKNTLIITALLCFCLKGYAQANLDETYDALFELGVQLDDLQDETLSISQSLIDSNAGIAVDVAHTTSDFNGSISDGIRLSRAIYFLLDKNNPTAISFSIIELNLIRTLAEGRTGRIDGLRGLNTNAALESILRDLRRLNLEHEAILDVLLSELP
tara:strand:+ start:2430 stop:2894 length:465 start_codon:yes stop_codon:yes gene_type:complete